MRRYIIRRILLAIPLLLAISFVCFMFINLIPSNPAEVALRVQQMPVITDAAIAEMEEMLGLNKPFLVRYFDWVIGCLQGDFGISYVNPARTVAGEILRSLPATLELAGASFVIVLVLSIPIGFLCAVYKDGWFDRIMRGTVFVSTAMPPYWVGLLLMWGIGVKLGWLPTNGSGSWRHLILPAFTLSLMSFANIALHTRQKLIDVLNSEYVLFARARGEGRWTILRRHGLRNILLPAMTLQFASFSELFGGSVMAENVFSYPGLGSAVSAAGLNSDVPLLLGLTLFSTLFVCTGNLIANLLYGIIDPRIKEAGQ